MVDPALACKVLEIEEGGFDDVLVVQEGFGVLDVAVFGMVDMVLLANVVVPIHPLRQKAIRPVMMFGDMARRMMKPSSRCRHF